MQCNSFGQTHFVYNLHNRPLKCNFVSKKHSMWPSFCNDNKIFHNDD